MWSSVVKRSKGEGISTKKMRWEKGKLGRHMVSFGLWVVVNVNWTLRDSAWKPQEIPIWRRRFCKGEAPFNEWPRQGSLIHNSNLVLLGRISQWLSYTWRSVVAALGCCASAQAPATIWAPTTADKKGEGSWGGGNAGELRSPNCQHFFFAFTINPICENKHVYFLSVLNIYVPIDCTAQLFISFS